MNLTEAIVIHIVAHVILVLLIQIRRASRQRRR